MGSGYNYYLRKHKSHALRMISERNIQYYMNILRRFAEYMDCTSPTFLEELEENLGWYYDNLNHSITHRLKAENLEFLEAIAKGDIEKLQDLHKRGFGVDCYKFVNLYVAFKNKQAKSVAWLRDSKYVNRPIIDYVCKVEDIDFFKELEKVGIFKEKLDYKFSLNLNNSAPKEFYENMSRISYAEVYDNANPILKKFLQEHCQEDIKYCLEFDITKCKVNSFNAKIKNDMLFGLLGESVDILLDSSKIAI